MFQDVSSGKLLASCHPALTIESEIMFAVRRHFLRSMLTWLACVGIAVVWLVAALMLRSPYLLGARAWLVWLMPAGGILAVSWRIWTFRRSPAVSSRFRLLANAVVIGGLIVALGQWRHTQNRAAVMRMTAAQVPALGNHLVVGWLGFDETMALATKGAIAGVFLTSRDFPAGSSVTDIRRTVDALQAARRMAGLPVLWIATDQEGGSVEKLTPPLPPQPPLASILRDLDGPGLADDPPRASEIARRVTAYADAQGRALADAGINLNFAPVLDLRSTAGPSALDFHSKISTRALASDPAIVSMAGTIYVRSLAKHGVTAVLKHFPGLGRTNADTHHFAATIDTPIAVLNATDWLPFREVARSTGAGIMLGHVTHRTLDPAHPASCSPAIMRGLLRTDWAVSGLLITDDFSMTPIFFRTGGIRRAAAESMAAGVDLILLSYDASAIYDLLAPR